MNSFINLTDSFFITGIAVYTPVSMAGPLPRSNFLISGSLGPFFLPHLWISCLSSKLFFPSVRQFLHSGKQTRQQILYFHLAINFILAASWFLTNNLMQTGSRLESWKVFFRLTTFIHYPDSISFWHTQFSTKLVDLFVGFKSLNQPISK